MLPGAGSSDSSSSSLVVSTSPDRSLVTRHFVPAKKIKAATCMSSVLSIELKNIISDLNKLAA